MAVIAKLGAATQRGVRAAATNLGLWARHKPGTKPRVGPRWLFLCPSVVALQWPRGTLLLCLALGGDGLVGCIPSVLLAAPLSSGGP